VEISALFEGAETNQPEKIELSPEAYELALHYDKLHSPAGKEAVKTILTLMSNETAA